MSTRTKVDVCNLALSKLGVAARISTLSDTTAHAIAAFNSYEHVVGTLFENHSWPFAETRQPLALLDEESASFIYDGQEITTSSLPGLRSDWSFRYLYPTDCGHIIELAQAGLQRSTSGIKVPFDIGFETGLSGYSSVEPEIGSAETAAAIHLTESASAQWSPGTGFSYRCFVVFTNDDNTMVSVPVDVATTYTSISGNPPTMDNVTSGSNRTTNSSTQNSDASYDINDPTFAGPTETINGIYGIGNNGYLYLFAGVSGNLIYRVDLSTMTLTTIASTDTPYSAFRGLNILKTGYRDGRASSMRRAMNLRPALATSHVLVSVWSRIVDRAGYFVENSEVLSVQSIDAGYAGGAFGYMGTSARAFGLNDEEVCVYASTDNAVYYSMDATQKASMQSAMIAYQPVGGGSRSIPAPYTVTHPHTIMHVELDAQHVLMVQTVGKSTVNIYKFDKVVETFTTLALGAAMAPLGNLNIEDAYVVGDYLIFCYRRGSGDAKLRCFNLVSNTMGAEVSLSASSEGSTDFVIGRSGEHAVILSTGCYEMFNPSTLVLGDAITLGADAFTRPFIKGVTNEGWPFMVGERDGGANASKMTIIKTEEVNGTFDWALSITNAPTWATKAYTLLLPTLDADGGPSLPQQSQILVSTIADRAVNTIGTFTYGGSPSYVTTPTVVDLPFGEGAMSAKFVYSDIEEAEAIYTRDLSEKPHLWAPMFTQVAAAAIAVDLLPTQVGMKMEAKQAMMAEYRALLSRALVSAQNEPHPKKAYDGEYIAGRF